MKAQSRIAGLLLIALSISVVDTNADLGNGWVPPFNEESAVGQKGHEDCPNKGCEPGGGKPPIVVISPGFNNPPGYRPAMVAPITYPSCSDWPNCDDNPTPATELSSVTGLEAFALDSETDHFTIWTDPNDPDTASYDAGEMQTVKDQLECAYRYFVCHLGMTPPRELFGVDGNGISLYTYDKRKVFIGDFGFSSANLQRIKLNDNLVTGGGAHKLYTTPVHEFFHHINKSQGAYVGSILEFMSEGLATLAEQMVSYDNMEKSFIDILRSNSVSTPHDPGSYAQAVMFRYLGEQLAGPPNQFADIDQDWGVDDIIEQLVLATTTATTPISTVMETVFNSNVSGNSFVQTYDEWINNFVGMLPSFRYVNPFRQPRLYFMNEGILANATPWGLGTKTDGTEFLAPGDYQYWDNLLSLYGINFGFYQFANPEYHQIEVDFNNVLGLRFNNAGSDTNIRFQLIARVANGNVFRRMILDGASFEEVIFPPGNYTVEEILIAVYSVNPAFPPLSPDGQYYRLEVEAF